MSQSKDPQAVDRARRRLLKAMAYTPPAVLASLLAGEAAQAASCGPRINNCNPINCGPAGVCDPDSNCSPFQGMGMM